MTDLSPLQNTREGEHVLLHDGGLQTVVVFKTTKTLIKLGKDRTEGWFRRIDGRPYGYGGSPQDCKKIVPFDADLLKQHEDYQRMAIRARQLNKVDFRGVGSKTVDHIWKLLEDEGKIQD